LLGLRRFCVAGGLILLAPVPLALALFGILLLGVGLAGVEESALGFSGSDEALDGVSRMIAVRIRTLGLGFHY
jgi:hypothetical protein